MKVAILGAVAAFALALPVMATAPVDSGLKVGDLVTPFHPTHVGGPDKGTDTCPPCKYGMRPAVQVWHNHDDEANLVAMIDHLGNKVSKSKNELKAFAIRVSMCAGCEGETVKLADKVKAKNVGIAHVASNDDAVTNYKFMVDNSVKNTVFVYKDKKVVAKFVNLKADKAGLAKLDAAIAKVDTK